MKGAEVYLDQFERLGHFEWKDFLPEGTVSAIRGELETTLLQGGFKQAGIGRLSEFKVDDGQRGDFIKWIDPTSVAQHTALYLAKLAELVGALNQHFYLGIRDYESHYTYYPAGTYYKRHSDRHKSGSARIVSMVFYLNDEWQMQDGGMLRIYNEDPSESVDICPVAGTLAVFLSEKEHEVLMTNRPRMSITGWMLNEKTF